MNKFNTTQIGNDFENKIFNIISTLLSNGELFITRFI